MPTANQEAAAHALLNAQRTGCEDAITLARRRQAAAAFTARNRAARDYCNELTARAAADPAAARAAELENDHQGAGYYSLSTY